MSKIGEYRRKAYELLYSSPLCEYAERSSKKNAMNVLILGNGWMGNEIFKAAFWAGQSVNTELNITVASQNAEEYEKAVLAADECAPFPALRQYIEKKHYANVRFVNVDVEEGIDESGLTPLGFEKNRYNYVVVSLGDAEHNWIAASEIVSGISKSQANGQRYTGKIIIHVFNEFSVNISREDQISLIQYGSENGIEISFFGGAVEKENDELNRIARNINFAYEMKYDQRANKNQADQKFAESLKREFIDSPTDYGIGDTSIISNFLGADYAADSSFAAVVHIPVKLEVCRIAVPDKDPIDTLKEAIRKKNGLYRKLIALEHRRWNAYTIMRGFRAPTVEEETKILYHDGNTHQAKKERLHICLCDCTENIALEQDFDRVYREWLDRKCPSNYPSELDRASLRVHQLTGQLVSKIRIDSITGKIKGENAVYSNLRHSILKLANDEDHSLALYQRSLSEAIAYSESSSDGEKENLDTVDKELMPFKVFNARTDFFGLDQQLVEMLPFALWYRVKNKTVLTVRDGSVTAAYDVIVPTLFCAENAIFIGKTVGSTRYQKSIESYFKSRGNNTNARFLRLTFMSLDTVFDSLDAQIQTYGAENIVINCVPNRSVEAFLAIGKLMGKYPGMLSVVQYVPNKGIVSFSDDKNIGIGLDNKSYSFSEYVQLMGGKVVNEYSMLYDSTQYDKLVSLFKEYCDSLKIQGADGKQKSFHPWAVMTRLLASAAKDHVLEADYQFKSNHVVLNYHGDFQVSLFTSAKIGNTLRQLQDYQILDDYTAQLAGDIVSVTFSCVDADIVEVLKIFEKDRADEAAEYKGLKFIPLNGGLKITDRSVQGMRLYDPLEDQLQIETKISFMRDLLKLGYISNLEIDDEGAASFCFKDEATMHLFKTQGAVFELIVYYFMRESGMFDAVETGVKISWDVDEELQEDVLLNAIKDSPCRGYGQYMDARRKLLYSSKKKPQSVMNEVDVIGITGMEGVMVSCKTSDKDSMQWIYEIKSVSDRFQSKGVMAISSDYSQAGNNAFLERAKQMNVPVWGTETLWNPEKMRKALQDVVNGFR
ncbi:MAG: hypothetical protein Q4F28_10855 [Eubacteriales bacterium]|nr:hypothetical protein [Eubacteriales bacterium]